MKEPRIYLIVGYIVLWFLPWARISVECNGVSGYEPEFVGHIVLRQSYIGYVAMLFPIIMLILELMKRVTKEVRSAYYVGSILAIFSQIVGMIITTNRLSEMYDQILEIEYKPTEYYYIALGLLVLIFPYTIIKDFVLDSRYKGKNISQFFKLMNEDVKSDFDVIMNKKSSSPVQEPVAPVQEPVAPAPQPAPVQEPAPQPAPTTAPEQVVSEPRVTFEPKSASAPVVPTHTPDDDKKKKIKIIVAIGAGVVVLLGGGIFLGNYLATKSAEEALRQYEEQMDMDNEEDTEDTDDDELFEEPTAEPTAEPTEEPIEEPQPKKIEKIEDIYESPYADALSERVEKKTTCEYYLYDIDQDGVEEAIITYGDYDGDMVTDVFTINENDKAKKIGEVTANCNLFIKDNKLYLGNQRMGRLTVTEVIKNGYKVKERTIYDGDDIEKKYPEVFNDKYEVSWEDESRGYEDEDEYDDEDY